MAPDGTEVLVITESGGGGNNLCQTVFDDAATASMTPLLSDAALFTGSFRPE